MRNRNYAHFAMLRYASKRTLGRVQYVRWRNQFLISTLLIFGAVTAYSETDIKPKFTNVVDTTAGSFAGFGTMPAISDSGAIAFIATGTNFGQGVFRWHEGRLETIASRSAGVLSNFGDDVVINCVNQVAFDASLHNSGDRAIFRSDGVNSKMIVDSVQQNLIGGQFLGLGAMNCSGTVVFSALRVGFQSQAIFAGNGAPLKVLEDTANTDFTAFGNVAINASGDVVFRAFRSDGSEGIFAGPNGSIDIVDTNNPAFSDFLDPVINREGVVAGGAFLSNGEEEAFTGTSRRFTPRTDPAGALTFIDNVAINSEGTLVFFADDSSGGQAIYIERREQNEPVAIIRSGDALFGSVVTGLNSGRFSVNDREHIVFQYSLQDGRSGIAIARLGYR